MAEDSTSTAGWKEDSFNSGEKFSMAFSYRLSASMSVSLSGDASSGLKFMDIYNMMLGEAKRLGHSEKVKVPKQTSKYIDAR